MKPSQKDYDPGGSCAHGVSSIRRSDDITASNWNEDKRDWKGQFFWLVLTHQIDLRQNGDNWQIGLGILGPTQVNKYPAALLSVKRVSLGSGFTIS